jgi:hypothetical protein
MRNTTERRCSNISNSSLIILSLYSFFLSTYGSLNTYIDYLIEL